MYTPKLGLNWGGARKGSGRPADYDEPCRKQAYYMPKRLIEELKIWAESKGVSASKLLVTILENYDIAASEHGHYYCKYCQRVHIDWNWEYPNAEDGVLLCMKCKHTVRFYLATNDEEPPIDPEIEKEVEKMHQMLLNREVVK